MNRISNQFSQTKPFVGYLTGGDGGVSYSLECAQALVEGGVDILEIGLPFSDPIADGPVIQRAHQRALEQGTTPSTLLELGRRLRASTDVPIVLFSYFNPLLQKGESYLSEVKAAGYDALLIVDLSVPDPFFDLMESAALLPVLLASPSTQEERLKMIGEKAKGFLYYVTQKGTTGIRNKLADDYALNMARLRRHVDIPIVAGFGIADRQSAKASLEHADGFVVGSAIVKKMEERCDPGALAQLAQAIDPRQYEKPF